MAVRKKPSALPVLDVLKRHMALTAQHKELMRQVETLRDAGKLDEALEVMERTEMVFAELQEIEERRKVRGPGD